MRRLGQHRVRVRGLSRSAPPATATAREKPSVVEKLEAAIMPVGVVFAGSGIIDYILNANPGSTHAVALGALLISINAWTRASKEDRSE